MLRSSYIFIAQGTVHVFCERAMGYGNQEISSPEGAK